MAADWHRSGRLSPPFRILMAAKLAEFFKESRHIPVAQLEIWA